MSQMLTQELTVMISMESATEVSVRAEGLSLKLTVRQLVLS